MSLSDSSRSIAAPLTHVELLRDKQTALDHYRLAYRSRALDVRQEKIRGTGRIPFTILGAGQEIAQIAATEHLRDGDWMAGYYRGSIESLAKGVVTVRQLMAQVLGDAARGRDPSSGGRQMGNHTSTRFLDEFGRMKSLLSQVNRASDVSSLAAQMPLAIGLGRASKVFQEVAEITQEFRGLSEGGREVVHVSIGDASLAEPIAQGAIAQYVVQKLPVVVSCYDNGYGISVPVDEQIPHASPSLMFKGFGIQPGQNEGMLIEGPLQDWNYPELRLAYDRAYRWVREGKGPAFVHVQVTQPFGHSSSGDHSRYKTPERLQWEKDHDGIPALRAWILNNKLATEEDMQAIESEEDDFVKREVQEALAEYLRGFELISVRVRGVYDQIEELFPELKELIAAERQVIGDVKGIHTIMPSLRRVGRVLKSLDPSGLYKRLRGLHDELLVEGRERYSSQIFDESEHAPTKVKQVLPRYGETPQTDSGAHIISAGLATMMTEDPRIVVFGEDTGVLGGVDQQTAGLQSGKAQMMERIWKNSHALQMYIPPGGFGVERVWDTAIDEPGIIGAAAGMAMRGLRPIAEIQYHDYVDYALSQIIQLLACLRHRTDGGQQAPALIRTHGHRLLGMWHSGSPMAQLLTIPGLRVLVPRDAVQAIGLYRSWLQGGDPAISVEPLLDNKKKGKPVPENLDQVAIPFGQSEVLREGTDVTIVTYGHCCVIAQDAAEVLQEEYGVSVEIVDLQTLNPIDLNDVAAQSIRKTQKVLFFDEDYYNGVTGMIAKTIVHERKDPDGVPNLFHIESLKHLQSPEHKPAYSKDGDYFSKPQTGDVVDAVCGMLDELDGGQRRLFS